MIETETNTPAKNPVSWLTPALVMWGSAAIVLGIIVLGTWLNNRNAFADTKEARATFDKLLADFTFTPEQRAKLQEEFDTSLDAAHSGDARRAIAQRLVDGMNQAVAEFKEPPQDPPKFDFYERCMSVIIKAREAK